MPQRSRIGFIYYRFDYRCWSWTGNRFETLVARYIGQKTLKVQRRSCPVLYWSHSSMWHSDIDARSFLYRGIARFDECSTRSCEEGYWYCKIAVGTTILLLSMVNNSILRGAGDSSLSLRSIAFSNLVNVTLDPLLIFGLFFFPILD